MSLDYVFRPISAWPGTMKSSRRRAPFRAGYQATLDLIDSELRQIGVRRCVIEAAFHPRDIRNDGRPRSDARPPGHPGVILSFTSRHGPMRMPCDTYTAWEDNLRAIGLALEALRAVDRYGVTQCGEQYRGWTALPPPEPGQMAEGGQERLREALRTLAAAAGQAGTGVTVKSSEQVQSLFREAAKRTHPDHGGTAEMFQQVTAARDVLEAHFAKAAAAKGGGA